MSSDFFAEKLNFRFRRRLQLRCEDDDSDDDLGRPHHELLILKKRSALWSKFTQKHLTAALHRTTRAEMSAHHE